MTNDVDLRRSEMRFAAVARAVILDGDHVLLARYLDNVNTFLPGGHIQIGEAAQSGLAREIQEEMDLTASVGDYLGAIESWWTDDIGYFGVKGRATHQIDHYFLTAVAGLSASAVPTSSESHLRFIWAKIGALGTYTLLPESLQQLIPRYVAGDHRPWWRVHSDLT
jgi:8-oxo-dGTP pyrophosphatase MutT (NUDIX family)